MLDDKKIFRKPRVTLILIGIISFIKIRFIGIFSPFELFASLFFLFQVISNSDFKIKIFENKIYQYFKNLLILWAICQLLSDIVNQSSISDSLKGVFAPLLIILSLRLLLILKTYFNYQYFIEDLFIGMSLCQIYYKIYEFSNFQTSIKFGLGFYSCLILFSLIKDKKINFILNLLFICLYLIYGVRSSLMISSAFFLTRVFQKKYIKSIINTNIFFNIRNGIIKYFTFILILLLLSPISRSFNNLLVISRPNDQRINILKSQSEGNFFSARLEYFSFFDSFKDAPILGHGSWPYDEEYKYYLLSQRGDPDTNNKTDREIIKNSKENPQTPKGIPYIPSHSFIQQNIVWAGIFASFFFFYALNLNLFLLSNSFINDSMRLLLISFTYDIFFSSIGFNRFYIPFACLTIIYSFISINKKIN